MISDGITADVAFSLKKLSNESINTRGKQSNVLYSLRCRSVEKMEAVILSLDNPPKEIECICVVKKYLQVLSVLND